MFCRAWFVLALVLAMAGAASAGTVEYLTNGDFATGDLTGWFTDTSADSYIPI